jgi:predicted Rossmann fold flavoprotein
MEEYDLVVIGGGAAGFFAAINAAEKNPNYKIVIIEKNRNVLPKVKVSGGGRCNVTNSCLNPNELIKNYPRGNDYLLEAFTKFGTKETFAWFEKHGVGLKTEIDGRVFPKTNSSQTIIDLFMSECYRLGIQIVTLERIKDIAQIENAWFIESEKQLNIKAKNLLIATGSDQRIWDLLNSLGVNIINPVPSLFTFNIKDSLLNNLQGVSFEKVGVTILASDFKNQGPFLITHWGISGPAVLKLSAWAARDLYLMNYEFKIKVNWLFDVSKDKVLQSLKENINLIPKKNVIANPMFNLTARFWKYVCEKSNILEYQKWAEMGKKSILLLAENLVEATFEVKGKSTFKEEFVTAGGVNLEEMDLATFSLKRYPNLYLAGEVLNIDAVTGGFNFQAAWTGGWIVGQSV